MVSSQLYQLALLVVVAATASLTQAARDILGAPVYSSSDFRQCGGRGGSCTGSTAAKCKDAQWPANEGGKCKSGLTCYRVSQYHWGCDTKQPPTAVPSESTVAPSKPTEATGAPSKPTKATESPSTPPMYVYADFQQCGGSGGSCTGSNAAKCKNAVWPADQGGSCKAGLKCYKVSQYYYSCDVRQPPTKSPTPVINIADYKQCGGAGGSCSGSDAAKCKDARWPSNQGGNCASSLKCYRISPYYWACDVKNPIG